MNCATRLTRDRDLIKRQREWIEDRDNYLENFITVFGLTLADEGQHYTNV